MNDLISRNEAWKAFDECQLFVDREDRDIAQEVIENLPAVEAKPVVHGEWIDNGIQDSILSGCSVCGYSCGAYSMNFCPNCGADMRKKVE